MSSPSIVLLDRSSVRAAVLRSWGYGVFATDHVVEVCLRWRPDDCAALVIGPLIAWREIATLCEWVKTNYAEAPILLLSERRLRRCPAHVDKVVPSRAPQALLECLRILLPGIADQPIRTLAGARSGSGHAGAVAGRTSYMATNSGRVSGTATTGEDTTTVPRKSVARSTAGSLVSVRR